MIITTIDGDMIQVDGGKTPLHISAKKIPNGEYRQNQGGYASYRIEISDPSGRPLIGFGNTEEIPIPIVKDIQDTLFFDRERNTAVIPVHEIEFSRLFFRVKNVIWDEEGDRPPKKIGEYKKDLERIKSRVLLDPENVNHSMKCQVVMAMRHYSNLKYKEIQSCGFYYHNPDGAKKEINRIEKVELALRSIVERMREEDCGIIIPHQNPVYQI